MTLIDVLLTIVLCVFGAWLLLLVVLGAIVAWRAIHGSDENRDA